jgi:hypothetical protein
MKRCLNFLIVILLFYAGQLLTSTHFQTKHLLAQKEQQQPSSDDSQACYFTSPGPLSGTGYERANPGYRIVAIGRYATTLYDVREFVIQQYFKIKEDDCHLTTAFFTSLKSQHKYYTLGLRKLRI